MFRRLPLIAIPLLLLTAPLTAQTVTRIEISPARVEASVGDTVRLTATAYDAAGLPVAAPITWFTSYEIGTIDSTGAFIAFKPGTREIGARAEGNVHATVPITIAPLPAARLDITAPATTVTATSWMPLSATASNRLGVRIFDADITWSSSDPRVGDVAGGYFQARRPGRTTLTARTGDTIAEQDLIVSVAVPGRLALVAPTGPIQTGDVFPLAPTVGGRPLTADEFPVYAVTGPDGRVYPDGAFVAEEPGEYLVVANYLESTATAGVRVEPREHDRRLELVGRAGVPAAHTADIWVDGNAVYLGTFNDPWLRVMDISDPAHPIVTDSLSVDARRINDVMMNPEQNFAIMTREGAANRVNGIVVLDITDRLHPTIASEYTETLSGGVHTTWIVDELVYAAHNGTSDMHIIDVSDRAHPREVGRWGLESPNRTLHDIFVKDGIAYLSYWDDGLVMLDLGGAGKGGTPTAPAFISRIYYPEGNTHTAWRWKDYVFVGDEIFPTQWDMDRPIAASGYIHVLDVSDIEHPVEVATYEVPEAGAHNIWINDDEETLYIAYYQAGLRALDVSGELRGDLYAQGRQVDAYLTEAGTDVKLPNATFAGTVMLEDGNIYTVDFNSGLWIHRMVPVGDRPIS